VIPAAARAAGTDFNLHQADAAGLFAKPWGAKRHGSSSQYKAAGLKCGEGSSLQRPTKSLRADSAHGVLKVSSMNMHSSGRKAFTLVEIMIVVAIIALLAAIAVPGFVRSRKRSQAAKILNDLRLIDAAVDQYAIESSKKGGDAVAVTDWTNYLKKDTNLFLTGKDLFGNDYGDQVVDQLPAVPAQAKADLAPVADNSFWSPYN
jgi:prepilin-type N-terminal cleavage/methylation domain-containing protein